MVGQRYRLGDFVSALRCRLTWVEDFLTEFAEGRYWEILVQSPPDIERVVIVVSGTASSIYS
jgi:hypothetical protein